MGPGSIDEAATVNGGRFVPANREVEPVSADPAGQTRFRRTTIAPAASALP